MSMNRTEPFYKLQQETVESGCFPTTAIWSDPYTSARELPLGKWHVVANGRIYQLIITAVSGGEVTGQFNGFDMVDAAWDGSAVAGVLTFTRVEPAISQQFTGYLMAFAPEDDKWRMAGVFGAIGAGVQAGWYATQPRGEQPKL